MEQHKYDKEYLKNHYARQEPERRELNQTEEYVIIGIFVVIMVLAILFY